MSTRFSPRQVEIIRLVAIGAADKEIAVRLGISVATVRTHLQRLYRDCGLRSRAEAVARLLDNEDGRQKSPEPWAVVVVNDVINIDD